MAFNNNFLEDIRSRADIVEVVSDYVKLELKGKNYTGLCPFHQEKTPSFTVNREKQLYYCFGCGAGGDIFNFLMEIENLPFYEAAKVLAERFGVPIPEYNNYSSSRKLDEMRDQLFAIHEWTTRYYQYLLMDHPRGQAAREYFEKRGFTRATIEKFRLGYAPQAWTALFHFLKKKGYSDYLLENSGLVLPSKQRNNYRNSKDFADFYDRFRDRAMFTIFNLRGQPIGFGGRVMSSDQSPKYLNSSETEIFIKNQNLYGLNFARDAIRQTHQAIIVEGYTDVITAHQHGVENVIASLGTSLTENQARLLARYAEEVYIAYDADTAGQSATLRGLDILKNEGLLVKVVQLPDSTDPDELIREGGAEKFHSLLQNYVSLIDFKLGEVIKNHDIDNPEGKVRAVQELLPLFLSIDNEIEKDYLLNQISDKVKTSRLAVERELEQFIKEKSKNKDKENKNWHTIEEKNKLQKGSDDAFEARFLSAIVKNPGMFPQIFASISSDCFRNPDYKLVVEQIYLYYLNRQNDTEGSNFPSLTTSELVESIAQERAKKLILELLFKYQEVDVTENFIKEGLNKIKEYQKTMEMGTIIQEIREIGSQGSLKDLNQTLIRYHCLLHHDSGKGGC